MEKLPLVKAQLSCFEKGRLHQLNEALDDLNDLAALIGQTLVDEPPFSVREGELIRDGFDGEVDRLRTILHETAQPAGEPWYIPGYGARNGIFAGSFSIFYTLPLSRKAPELPPGLTDDDLAPGVPPDTPTEEPTDSSTPEGIAPEGAPVEQTLEPETTSPSPDENPNNQPEI